MLPMLPNVHEAVGFMLAKTCKPGPSFVSLTTDHPTWEVSKQNSNRNIGLVFLVCLVFLSSPICGILLGGSSFFSQSYINTGTCQQTV